MVIGRPEVERLRELVNEIVVGTNIGGGVGARTTKGQNDEKGEDEASDEDSDVDEPHKVEGRAGIGLAVEDEETGELECLVNEPEEEGEEQFREDVILDAERLTTELVAVEDEEEDLGGAEHSRVEKGDKSLVGVLGGAGANEVENGGTGDQDEEVSRHETED